MFSTVLRSFRITSTLSTTHCHNVARAVTGRMFLCDKASTGPPKQMVQVSNFDKSVLLKAKMYNNLEEIPEYVSPEKIKKARDYMRIRVNIWMVIATIGGCIVTVIIGRRMRDSGDSLRKRGLEWETSMRKQGLKEEAERKAAEEKAAAGT